MSGIDYIDVFVLLTDAGYHVLFLVLGTIPSLFRDLTRLQTLLVRYNCLTGK